MAEGAIGAGLSIGEMSLGALVEIKASIDGLAKQVNRLVALEEQYQTRGPVQVPLRASGTSPSSGAFILDLGGPSYGRLWEVRRLIIGGNNWGSTVGGRADVIISSTRPSLNARNLADIVDEAVSLPSRAFYSSGQVVLRSPDRLYVVIANPTASTAYSVGGAGYDVPDSPTRAVVER